MRILTVCTSAQVYGAEVITLKLLQGLKRAGHEQLAITSVWTDGEFSRRLATVGITELRLPFGFFSRRLTAQALRWTATFLTRVPELWLRWRRAVQSFNPDVIVLTSTRLALPILPFLGDVPAILVEHANLTETSVRRMMHQLFSRRLRAIVAVSDFSKHYTERTTGTALPVHVIKNGPFGAAERNAMRAAVDTATTDKPSARPAIIGIVGQVSHVKGHDTLLEAARLLNGRGLPVEVRVFGSGDPVYVAELTERARQYDLATQWKWMGYKGDQASIYRNMDICVMPSRCDEAFGMVAAEAGGYALPVVASDRGALPELIIDGQTGFLVDPESPSALADKLAWLVTHPSEARNIGARAHDNVFKHFTAERMTSQFEDLFRQLMTARR